MDDRRQLVCIYCDDVRQEIGNKLTLVGTYGPDLFVPSFPQVLAKFGAYIRLITPIELPFQQLKIKMLMNSEQVLGELDVPISEVQSRLPSTPPEAKWTYLQTVLLASPLVLEGPGEIRIEAQTETGLMRGNRLRIAAADLGQMFFQPQLAALPTGALVPR